VAAPIPLDAPVTRAVLSWRERFMPGVPTLIETDDNTLIRVPEVFQGIIPAMAAYGHILELMKCH
jgi:hypothetical protein